MTKIFYEILIIFSAVTVTLLIVKRLRIPSILGFLSVGIIIGPSGFSLLSDSEHIHIMSELGVILLLFTIGLEVSPSKLWKLRREIFLGGGLQLLITSGAAMLCAIGLNIAPAPALIIGFAIAMSSTAVVLKIFNDMGIIDAPYGKNALAILLAQDLSVIPVTIFIVLFKENSGSSGDVTLTVLKSVGVLIFGILLSKFIIPKILIKVSELRSREGYLFGVGTIVIGTAGLTYYIDLSPAIGAFIAGLAISETEHKYVILSETTPFRDLFLTLFFISSGMILDISFIVTNPFFPIIGALAIYIIKGLIIVLITKFALNYSVNTGLRTGLALGQLGELSIVIVIMSNAQGLISMEVMQNLLTVSAISIFLTPIFISLSNHINNLDINRYNPNLEQAVIKQTPHIVIIGFGPGGRLIAGILKSLEIRYSILEMNPITVKKESIMGEPIFLGDASKVELLKKIHIDNAKAAVIAISDYASIKPIVKRIKSMAPNCHLIVRTKYADEYEEITKLGVDTVILSEIEASIKVAKKLGDFLNLPPDVINRHVDAMKYDGVCSIDLKALRE